MSNEPKNKQRSSAKLTAKPELYESEGGALMLSLPYALVGDDFAGNHTICIGAKDGTMMEKAIQNLMDVFKLESITAVTSVEPSEGDAPQFDLSDWQPKSDTNKYAGWQWLNACRTAQPIEKIVGKWGDKLALFTRNSASSEPVAEQAHGTIVLDTASAKPKRGRPAGVKNEAKEPRKISEDAMYQLLYAKYGVDQKDQDAVNAMCKKHYYPVTDELFGEGKDPTTEEQFGAVADKLGL